MKIGSNQLYLFISYTITSKAMNIIIEIYISNSNSMIMPQITCLSTISNYLYPPYSLFDESQISPSMSSSSTTTLSSYSSINQPMN